jgi:predicted NAD/FAD-dependent oxidoreductase
MCWASCCAGAQPDNKEKFMHIAIVGAGLAGLICARQLQEQGNHVTVYEKKDEISGRMNTHQTELGGFDCGAQYFTARTPEFRKAIAAWRKAKLVAPWNGKLVRLENGQIVAPDDDANDTQRYVAMPGMNALACDLAQTLDVRVGQWVKSIEQHNDQWLLKIEADTVPIEASAGPFDAVILAIPAAQAYPLLFVAPKLAAEAERARYVPCWSLMMAFQDPLAVNYDGAWIKSSRLSWIARDTSKQERRAGEHWVAHAGGEWSIEHFDDDDERIKEKLLKAFHDATGTHVQPVYATVHRWRYAQATVTISGDCLWDNSLRIGACGDWFEAGLDGSGRVENAYLSGVAMAEALRLAVH